MLQIFSTFIARHTPPVLSILLFLCAGIFYIGEVVNDGFDSMKSEWRSDWIAESRKPAYAMLLSSLDKQTEKLNKDPGDLKDSDIALLFNQCNSDFGMIYIPTLPHSQKTIAKRTCEAMGDLYIERQIH